MSGTMDGQVNRYASSIDLNDLNTSWAILIHWAGRNRCVLDVGCGRGQLGRILHEQFGCTVTGIELNAEFARECVGYERLIVGSAQNPELLAQIDERFDVIVCGDVLEHLPEPHLPLRAFHRLLHPAGRLLISVPNVAQIRTRLMLLRGHWDYTPEGIMDETHVRWFTLDTLQALTTRCGWTRQDFAFTVGPNLERLMRRWHIPRAWAPPTLLASQFLLNLAHEENAK